MPSLQERLASVLGDVVAVEEEPDGALTVRHGGTIASSWSRRRRITSRLKPISQRTSSGERLQFSVENAYADR